VVSRDLLSLQTRLGWERERPGGGFI